MATKDDEGKSADVRVRVSPRLLERLKAMAGATGIGESEITRRGIHRECSDWEREQALRQVGDP